MVGLHDPSGSNAGRANFNSLVSTLNNNPYSMQVWIPSSFRDVIGVAYIIPEHRGFSTDLTTSSHLYASSNQFARTVRIAEGILMVKRHQQKQKNR